MAGAYPSNERWRSTGYLNGTTTCDNYINRHGLCQAGFVQDFEVSLASFILNAKFTGNLRLGLEVSPFV
jgi:hypothetical protein